MKHLTSTGKSGKEMPHSQQKHYNKFTIELKINMK